MVKSTVIFSDQDQNKKEEKNFSRSDKDLVSLSRDEYRQLIKEAFQEGREDALKEQKKHEPLHQEKKTAEMTGKGQQQKEPFQLTGKGQTKKFTKQKEENRQRLKEITVPEQEKDAIELEGKEEAIKLRAQEKEENMQRFRTITARQDKELLRAQTVWPFNFFASTLVIDTTKVTLARKQLFATEYVTTIPLKDLSDATVQTVMFLGTLMIRYMPQSNTPGMNEPINVRIPNLNREDAIRAKNILKGALVAKAEEIDIAKLSPDEIEQVLHKFGESEGVT